MATAGASLEGAQKKKPTAGFASGGGLETFSSLLAVSPRARSGNSRHSRSRLGRRSSNSLSGDGQHTNAKITQLRWLGKGDKSKMGNRAGRVWELAVGETPNRVKGSATPKDGLGTTPVQY